MNNKDKIEAYRGSLTIPGGPTGILLVHSLGGNPIELRFVAQGLARAGYTVHCPVVPGLAGGTDVSGLSSWEDWYQALEAELDELRTRCDNIIVGGLSAGSMLALRLARERAEDVEGVMLFAPTIIPNGWAIPPTIHLFRLVREKWFAKLFHFQQRAPYGIKDERIRNFVIESFKSEDRPIEDLFGRGGGLVFEFFRLGRDVKKRFGEITQPTAIFHPREDDQSDLSNAVKIQRGLGGLAELTVLDDCYHMVTLDRQRNIVVDRAVEFADRLASDIVERRSVASLVSDRALKK